MWLFWCIYLVTGNIAVTRTIPAATAAAAAAPAGANPQRKQPLNAATQVAFKTFAPFKKCRTEINNTFVDEADFIDIAISMYNLIEYNDNYSDTSGSLFGFKRNEVANNADVTNDDNAPSFSYKASRITNTEVDGTKVVSLRYLSNFWRSLEMPLINCKVELSLKWIEYYILTL